MCNKNAKALFLISDSVAANKFLKNIEIGSSTDSDVLLRKQGPGYLLRSIEAVDFDEINQVETLVISNIKLQSLDSFIIHFRNITYLNCSFNNLVDVSCINTIQNLIHLDVSHNKLSSLPNLSNLINLKTLRCQSNFITTLEDISYFQNLHELIINNNTLNWAEVIYFSSLRVLKHLVIYENPLETKDKIYEFITALCPSLHTLNGNQLELSNLKSIINIPQGLEGNLNIISNPRITSKVTNQTSSSYVASINRAPVTDFLQTPLGKTMLVHARSNHPKNTRIRKLLTDLQEGRTLDQYLKDTASSSISHSKTRKNRDSGNAEGFAATSDFDFLTTTECVSMTASEAYQPLLTSQSEVRAMASSAFSPHTGSQASVASVAIGDGLWERSRSQGTARESTRNHIRTMKSMAKNKAQKIHQKIQSQLQQTSSLVQSDTSCKMSGDCDAAAVTLAEEPFKSHPREAGSSVSVDVTMRLPSESLKPQSVAKEAMEVVAEVLLGDSQGDDSADITAAAAAAAAAAGPTAVRIYSDGTGFSRLPPSAKSAACSYIGGRLSATFPTGRQAVLIETQTLGSAKAIMTSGCVMSPAGVCLLSVSADGTAVEMDASRKYVTTYKRNIDMHSNRTDPHKRFPTLVNEAETVKVADGTEASGAASMPRSWAFDDVEVIFDASYWEVSVVITTTRAKCVFSTSTGGHLIEEYVPMAKNKIPKPVETSGKAEGDCDNTVNNQHQVLNEVNSVSLNNTSKPTVKRADVKVAKQNKPCKDTKKIYKREETKRNNIIAVDEFDHSSIRNDLRSIMSGLDTALSGLLR